jgi:hypothetical protein
MIADWQRTLRLLDWRIQARYVADLSTQRGPVHGLCWPVADSKTAQIAIRDPQTPIGDADPSVEETVIHELIHLHFAPLAENTPAGITAEEQAVWALTEALAKPKNAGQRALLARAMVAALPSHTRMQPLQGMVRSMIDPVVLAALKAAATSDDPAAAIQALISQFESASGDGDSGGEAPLTEAPTAADPNQPPKPPMQAAPPMAMQPKQARPLPAATPGRVVDVEVRRRVSAVDERLDKFEVEGLLEKRPDLNDAQRSFGRTLRPEGVRAWLATVPVSAAAQVAGAPQGAARQQLPTSPMVGARDANAAPADPETQRQLGRVDHLMNVRRAAPQAVRIDDNGRLSISNLAPVVIATQGK